MNKVILTGRLTKDPEVRYNEELCIARYTLAVDRRIKSEGHPTADFLTCVAFGNSGRFAEKYFKKGTKISIVGRIQTRSYADQNNVNHYVTEIVIEEQEFAESKKAAGESNVVNIPTIETDENGFMNIPDGIDEELPFN